PASRRVARRFQLLVRPRGRDRLGAPQVWFHAHGRTPCRDYLILYRPAKQNDRGVQEPSGWWAWSLPRKLAALKVDLRRPEHARRLETALLQLALDPLPK